MAEKKKKKLSNKVKERLFALSASLSGAVAPALYIGIRYNLFKVVHEVEEPVTKIGIGFFIAGVIVVIRLKTQFVKWLDKKDYSAARSITKTILHVLPVTITLLALIILRQSIGVLIEMFSVFAISGIAAGVFEVFQDKYIDEIRKDKLAKELDGRIQEQLKKAGVKYEV